MNQYSNHFTPKGETPFEKLDEVLNHMRAQLDYLCKSAETQNEILKSFYEKSNDSRNECENSND